MEHEILSFSQIKTTETSLIVLIHLLLQKYFIDTKCVLQVMNQPQEIIPLNTPSYIMAYSEFADVSNVKIRCNYLILHDPPNHEIISNIITSTNLITNEFKIIMMWDKASTYFNYFDYRSILNKLLFIKLSDNKFELWQHAEGMEHLCDWDIQQQTFSVENPNFFGLPADIYFGKALYYNSLIGDNIYGYDLFLELGKKNNRTVDIDTYGIGPSDYHEEEIGKVYSYPIYKRKLIFSVPNPKIIIDWFTHIHVLEPPLWFFIILCYFLGAIYFYIEYAVLRIPRQPHLFLMLGLFLSQGWTDSASPRHRIGKIVYLLLLCLTILFSSMYSSGIVASMLTPKYTDVFNSLEDVINSNLKVFPRGLFFKEPETELEARLRHKMLNDFTQRDYDYTATENGVSEYTHLVTYQHEYHPNSHLLHEEYLFSLMRYRIGYKLWFPLIVQINDLIIRSRDAGLLLQWDLMRARTKYSIFDILKQLDIQLPPMEPTILTLEHVYALFATLAIGLSASFVIFILEIFKGYCKYTFREELGIY